MQTRFLNLGENVVNSYIINVERVVSAQQVSETSRIAARYFGTITAPNGEVTRLGEKGKTAGQIKALVGVVSTRESSEITQLKKALAQLRVLGLSTEEVEAKIATAEAREAEEREARAAAAAANSAAEKARKKELKKLQQVREQLIALGVSTAEIDTKIEGLQ